jgi:PAS domain S-box-containing protein
MSAAPTPPARALLVSHAETSEIWIRSLIEEDASKRFGWGGRVETIAEAIDAVERQDADLVLVDLCHEASESALESLSELCERERLTPVLVLTDSSDENFSLRALQVGAQDCLLRAQLSSTLLQKSMRYALERTRAERELAMERDLLHALLDSIPDRIYFKDRQSRFLRISRAMADFFHLDEPGEAVGRTDFDYFTDEHARPAYNDEQEIIRTGTPLVGKIEKETLPDGRIGWAHTTKLPLRNRKGLIVGTCGISRDITELKALEDALATERNLLRSVIDHVPDPIYAVDEEGAFLVSNVAHASGMGTASPEAVLGKNAADFLPEATVRTIREAEDKLFSTGDQQIDLPERLELSDGMVRCFLTTRVPLKVENGGAKSLVCIGRDVTTIMEAQDALAHANADLAGALADLKRVHGDLRSTQLQLIEAEKMKSIGRLAAGVAHEVKNPLATISMGLEFLLRQEYTQAEIHDVLTDLSEAVVRADTVIKGLLDFSAPKRLDLVPQDLNLIVRSAVRLVRGECRKGQITVETDLGDLPLLELDRIKIGQVFVNVFTNAIHAMGESGTLSISTRAEQVTGVGGNISGSRSEAFRAGQRVVVVKVEDTGPGIPESKLDKVFEPFYTTKPTGKGTGLGMTVVKSIIDLHGGTVEVFNRKEGGACVTIALKIHPPSSCEES